MTVSVYRLIEGSVWRPLHPDDALPLRDIDRRDGYIHLSTAAQVLETARRHFAGCDDLVALEFCAEELGSVLRWEPARDGELFPHVYGQISMRSVRRSRPLVLDTDHFCFGDGS